MRKTSPTPVQMALSATVEGGEAEFAAAALLDVEVEEIDDVLDGEAVDEVADDAADDEAEGGLPQPGLGVEMVAAEVEDDEGAEGDDGQQAVIAF